MSLPGTVTERRMLVRALSTGQVRVLLTGSQETVGGFDADGTRQSRLSYIGHDADAAERARLVKVDAACYELIAANGDLGPIVTTQLTIPGLARPTEEP